MSYHFIYWYLVYRNNCMKHRSEQSLLLHNLNDYVWNFEYNYKNDFWHHMEKIAEVIEQMSTKLVTALLTKTDKTIWIMNTREELDEKCVDIKINFRYELANDYNYDPVTLKYMIYTYSLPCFNSKTKFDAELLCSYMGQYFDAYGLDEDKIKKYTDLTIIPPHITLSEITKKLFRVRNKKKLKLYQDVLAYFLAKPITIKLTSEH
ncbi:12763_t:CDS:2, partial [Racocetra persica]